MVNNASLSNALSAYRMAAARQTEVGQGENIAASKPFAEGSFKDMLKGVVTDAVDASRKSETLSMKALAGEADVQEVVAAVSNAEMALETVVAVRDSVVRAYQEILRMPI